MLRSVDVATSYLASGLRLGAGMTVHAPGNRPTKTLELYEFEACPFCRRVREVLSSLDLEAIVYPCPKGGRHRARVRELGGKEQFPFLVDPNSGDQLYESSDIIRHLVDRYGDGRAPQRLLATASSVAGVGGGAGRGVVHIE